MFSEPAEPPGPSRFQAKTRQLNNSLHELYKPLEVPTMQILFFPGLHLGDQADPYLWESVDGSTRSLAEEFPCAHIFLISYTRNNVDSRVIGENLLSDLMEGNIGQVPDCPIILVGHSIGKLLIKKICLQAYEKVYLSKRSERAKLYSLLDNVKGIFCYGTQTESPDSANAKKVFERPLLESYFEILSNDAERINFHFAGLCHVYSEWKITELFEALHVNSGLVHGIPEAPSREGDTFNVLVKEEDHPSRTEPSETTSRIFYTFTEFLRSIELDMKEAIRRRDEGLPENLQFLPKNITGIDTQLEEMKATLRNSRTLGIAGMGGVGKTTLAKALFNELISTFEYTCFVSGVFHIEGSVQELKKRMWGCMYYHGEIVREKEEWFRLKERRLLLVLDDISSERDVQVLMDLCEMSSYESRFIVTSRNLDSSMSLEVIYVVPLLDLSNSRKLFKSLAFATQDTVRIEFESLVETIVRKCDGLPLVLEVIAKYLKGKENRDDWEQTLHALETAESTTDLGHRLWAKLRLSYDALDAETQQMFLDVATFFGGNEHWTLSDARTAWEIVYSNVAIRWQTLVQGSLVYDVKDDESIKVHPHLKTLGEKIAFEYKFRIWDEATMSKLLLQPNELDEQEIHALLLGKTGDDHEEGNEIKEVRIAKSALQRLKTLRFLDVNIPIVIEGAQESELFPTKLALFHCDARSELSRAILHPDLSNTLAILRLSWQKDLCLPESIWYFSALKRLILSSATYLESLPNQIGQMAQLEILELRQCPCLGTLPETFGRLSNLSRLLFIDCENLRSLPESFGHLPALRYLHFEKCEQLQMLPQSFGNLSALGHLHFEKCAQLQLLPDSFGNLSALRHLHFEKCEQLQMLPESFGNLLALRCLHFEKCEQLQMLPESFGNLSALRCLHFEKCEQLQTLPESFGYLSALERLHFEKCAQLQLLPESFGHLTNLSHLEFKECESFHFLPQSFGHLSSLSQLKFRNCENLHSLPESFAYLSALSHLEFEKCHSLRSLPDSSYLRFDHWEDLQCYPDSLRKLILSALQLSTSVPTAHEAVCRAKCQTWDGTAALNPRQEEDEFDEKDIDTPQLEPQVVNSEEVHDKGTTLQSLKKSPLIIDGAQSLKDFSASACLHTPHYLIISNCPDLTELRDNISQLVPLRSLQIQDCKSLTEIPAFLGELKGLEQLIILNCPYLVGIPETIGNLRSLRYLKIQDCADLTNLPKSLGALRDLEQLIIWNCPRLVGIPDTIMHLGGLQHLRIEKCASLKDLPESVGRLQCLKRLIICNCPCLVEIPDTIGRFGALRTLHIEDCKGLVIVSETLKKFKALENVVIYNCANVGIYLKISKGKVSIVRKAPANERSSKSNVGKVKSVSKAARKVVYEQETSGSDVGPVVDLTRRAEEFTREVEKGGEDGYFVSSKGLLSLEESQRQSIKLTLWEAGYSEIYQTPTTTLFAKLKNEEENRITFYDASSAFEENRDSLGDVDEVGASKRDDDLLGYERRDLNLGINADNIADMFKAALERISTTFDYLFHFFFLFFIASISPNTWYKRTRLRMQNQGGGGLGASSSSSSNESDVAGGNNDNTTDSLVSATTERGRNEGESFDCRPQRLRVACSPNPPTSSVPSSDPDEIVLEHYGDDHCVLEKVTMPDLGARSTETISTCIDRRFSIPAVEFSGEDRPVEVIMSMNATATTRLSCCLSKHNDHQRPKVRIKFSIISGKVESRDLNKQACNVVIVSCVGTTVYGCTRRTDNEREFNEIALDLDDEYRLPRGRVVEPVREGQSKSNPDLVWLKISSSDAKNCKPGSVTVGLRGDVNERLEEDLQTKVQRANTLSFVNGENPVKFEGNIGEGNLLNSFLELRIRYKLEVCYYLPVITSAEEVLYCPGRTSPETIDFDCSLIFRSESLTH